MPKPTPIHPTAAMAIEFRKANTVTEARRLAAFDRKIFRNDAFLAKEWRKYAAWWMLLNGKKIGCCAFQHGVDFQPHIGNDANPPRSGCLYVATTAIDPKLQGRGFGKLMKAWQIAYARYLQFDRVVTNCRQSNEPIIRLNRQFGFKKVKTVARYYDDPVESTVVMELLLRKSAP